MGPEIIAAAIGALLTAIFGFLAYVYRPKLSYEISDIQKQFTIKNDKLAKGTGSYVDTTIVFVRIELKNRSFVDIKDVTLDFSLLGQIIMSEVVSTTSMSERAVNLHDHDGSFVISTTLLPRQEKLCVELAYKGFRSYSPKLKGRGGKYCVVSETDVIDRRNSILFSIAASGAAVWFTYLLLRS